MLKSQEDLTEGIEDLAPEEFGPETDEEEQEKTEEEAAVSIYDKPLKKAVQLKAAIYIFAALALLIALSLIVSNVMVHRGSERIEDATTGYILAAQAANDFEAGSEYLTETVRAFAVTGEIGYLEDYFEEVFHTKRRDEAVETLYEMLDDDERGAYDSLSKALDQSNELMLREYESMRLIQVASGYPDSKVPEAVSGWELTDEEEALSPEQMREKAVSLVFDDVYSSHRKGIEENIRACTDQLLEDAGEEVVGSRTFMSRILMVQNVLLILLMINVLAVVIFITMQVSIPLTRLVETMRKQQTAKPDGAEELQFVTSTYNEILEENLKANRQLSYEATHDPLTGIYNRSVYEEFLERSDKDSIALMVIDIDEFKTINDTYGHDVGDRILKKVARILRQSFRSGDCVSRLGGDEFAVVMTKANSTMRQLVINKIANVNEILRHPEDGLPEASISAGVAFSDCSDSTGDLFRDADTALYQVKKAGRCGCMIYGDRTENDQ